MKSLSRYIQKVLNTIEQNKSDDGVLMNVGGIIMITQIDDDVLMNVGGIIMITQIDDECMHNNEDVTITSKLWYEARSVVGYSTYNALEDKYSELSNNILSSRFKLNIVRLINGQLNDYKNNMRIHRR